MTTTIKVTDLPNAGVLSGTELVPVVQGGTTKQTTTLSIAELFSGPGSGTVTSVGLSAPAIFTVSGSPVTTSGTLTLSLATQAANLIWGGPSTGVDATPTFRALVDADLPVVSASKGGTGISSYAIGDIIYASGATTLAKLADIATGNALISGGVGVAPSWGKIGLTTHVSGILPAANGGTGLSSYTIGDLVYASGASALSSLADIATGNVLLSGGVGVAPAYGKVGLTTHVSGTLAVTNGGTGVNSVTAYAVLCGGTGSSGPLQAVASVGSSGQALISSGAGALPAWAGFLQAGTGAVSRTWQSKMRETVSPEDFGAAADGVYAATGVATSGDNTFTATGVSWTSADIGKPIVIAGAGAAGVTLATTIASINSTTSIELTLAPSTTVASSAKFYYGTNDTTAFQAAIDSTSDGQGVILTAGRIYMVDNLSLKGGTGSYGFLRKGLQSIGGMATIAPTGQGNSGYLVASARWVTGAASSTFADAPYIVDRIVFDAFGVKDLAFVHKFFSSIQMRCVFQNALVANYRFTRQNQDGSLGTTSYLSGTTIESCFSVSTLAGVTTTYGFQTQGEAGDETQGPTDGTMIDCQAFAGAGAMTTAIYFSNTGGWTVIGCRTFSCATGLYIYQCGKNSVFNSNNWDTNNFVAARVFQVGTYIDFAAFSNDTFYSDLYIDFSNDATTEVFVVENCKFWFDPTEGGQSHIIHNNNRASKIIRAVNCVGQDSNLYQRSGGNTLGVYDVYLSYSVEDPTNYQRQYIDSGATGVVDRTLHLSASPAASDILRQRVAAGMDSGGNTTSYVTHEDYIRDPTDGSEDGGWRVNVMVAGALTQGLSVDDLGTTVRSNLLLGSASVINWNSGDVTLTHSSNLLSGAGGQFLWTYGSGATTAPARFVNDVDSAFVTGLTIDGDRATPAANDTMVQSFFMSNGSGTQKETLRIASRITTITAGAEVSDVFFSILVGGAVTSTVALTTASWRPSSNDGAALGSVSTSWSDLFLATGGVINWNNGTYTLTQSGTTLTSSGTLATADLTVTNTPRINQTPAAIGTGVKTISNAADSTTNFGKYLQLNMNGTTYYVPCSTVAPT